MISLSELTQSTLTAFQHDILDIERNSFPTPWSLNAFFTELDRPMSHLWVAQQDGDVRGYICFWIVVREIHLMNLAVHPLWRRKGVGGRLLRKMIEIGTTFRAELAFLEVRPSNSAARIFYSKAGFRETGRRPGYYDDTHEDAIIMAMSLTSEAFE
jgi:ribosomal-protein-alanine N-acetyltransferase